MKIGKRFEVIFDLFDWGFEISRIAPTCLVIDLGPWLFCFYSRGHRSC